VVDDLVDDLFDDALDAGQEVRSRIVVSETPLQSGHKPLYAVTSRRRQCGNGEVGSYAVMRSESAPRYLRRVSRLAGRLEDSEVSSNYRSRALDNPTNPCKIRQVVQNWAVDQRQRNQ
jgi:hypothetical protein